MNNLQSITYRFHIPPKSRFLHLIIKNSVQEIVFFESLPLMISSDLWDDTMQRPINIYLKKHKLLNRKINLIKNYLQEFLSKQQIESVFFDSMLLHIQNICKQPLFPRDFDPKSLLYYIDFYLRDRQNIITKSTYRRYKVFFYLIERFEWWSSEILYINSLTIDVMKSFVEFSKCENYSETTINRTISFIKTVVSFANSLGINTNYSHLRLRNQDVCNYFVTLSESELLQIEKTLVPDNLRVAKDWLLISCYTGQRISDFMQFNSDKLIEINGSKCISFIQVKTKKEVILPLHPKVIKILNRNNNCFPPTIRTMEYNNHIKEVVYFAKIDNLIKVRKRIGHRSYSVTIEKWQAITSHVGRRSFATNFYGKIPTPLLMIATGHSTEQMFLKYIDKADQSKIVSLASYFNKLDNR